MHLTLHLIINNFTFICSDCEAITDPKFWIVIKSRTLIYLKCCSVFHIHLLLHLCYESNFSGASRLLLNMLRVACDKILP